MKNRITFFKNNLNKEKIEYFKYLRDVKHFQLNDACKAMAKKYPDLNIGNAGFSLLIDGIAIMTAITEYELYETRKKE